MLMGHYSQEHVEVTAAEAAGAIMHAEDPLRAHTSRASFASDSTTKPEHDR